MKEIKTPKFTCKSCQYSKDCYLETCKRYSYRVSTYNNRPIHIATYRNFDGEPIFQKIRFTDSKEFFIVGKAEQILYGSHLFQGRNKKIIITEGEIDCLSIAQVVGDYPVVSIPMGAANGIKAIKHNLQWLESFEEVVFCFDMDEAGRKAAKECASVLSFGKAKIMSLPLKDANEMLKENKIKELYKATWEGTLYKPEGLTDGSDLREEIRKPVEYGLSYPWENLTKITYGIRKPEMICIGAGTGMGKTTIFKEIEAHLILEHKKKIGIIHLEELAKDTLLGLMSIEASIPFHIPDIKYKQSDFDKAEEAIIGKCLIDKGFGSSKYQDIESTIRYMVKGYDCEYIFLDHITALADGLNKDVNQQMRNIVSSLASLTRELNFTLFLISHLRKADGQKSHEEGGRVHLDDLYGAAALKQWCSFVFGLERNQQAKDEKKRNQTAIRCLKDRYTGQGTGQIVYVSYDRETGRVLESEYIEEKEEFKEEDGEF